MEISRRIYNPIQKDPVTFLKTAGETGGEYTLVEVELSSKGGVGLHYHKTYSEKFDSFLSQSQGGQKARRISAWRGSDHRGDGRC